LVEDLIVAGYGVGLLPLERPTNPGVTVVPLAGPTVIHTAYAVTRKGRATWPPLRAVLDRLRPADGPAALPAWPRPTAG
jgi:hypothetical protein